MSDTDKRPEPEAKEEDLESSARRRLLRVGAYSAPVVLSTLVMSKRNWGPPSGNPGAGAAGPTPAGPAGPTPGRP